MKESHLNLFLQLYFAWLVFIFFFTEALSYLHQISRQNIILGNLIFFSLFIFKKDLTKLKFTFSLKNKFSLIIFLILTLTFIQGLFSAPSTTDAMTYQILRIMYWIQEKSVNQDFIRNSHDFMPPFASYILMHLYLIFNGDRFLFLSQWLAFAGSVFLSRIIGIQLGADKKLSQIISVLVATTPIAVLQATSTQADMVSAFLILLNFYLVLNLYRVPSHKNIFLLGIALGLGMLVKAPFYIFVITPFSLFFFLLAKNPKKTIVAVVIVLAVAFSMNLRYYSQNLKLYGNLLGQKFSGRGNTYVNERFDPPAVTSNLIRDTINNIPIPFITNQAQSALVALHNKMGIDILDPRTSYIGLNFRVAPILYPQEDVAASPLNILLIILAGFFVFRKSFKAKKKPELRILYIFLVMAYILFAVILKWESFHNRLLVAFLISGTIIAALIMWSYSFGRNIIKLFIFLSVPLSFILILLNVQHPYISYKFFYDKVKNFSLSYQIQPEAFYEKLRIKQYFNSRPYWFNPYDKVTDLIAEKGNSQTITMELMDDEFEYPLWALLKEKGVSFYIYQNKFLKKDVTAGSILLTTSEKPITRKGFKTTCFKTQTEYGYACLSELE